MTDPTTPEECDALLREVLGDAYQPPAHQDCTITFPLHHVQTAAEHAAAAPHHALGPGETATRPRLWWIKSDGILLMSNGVYRTRNTRDADGRWSHIVYADDWGPGTDPSTILGGDDLNESLDLTQPPTHGGPALIELLRTAPEDATRFLLQVTHTDDGMNLTMTVK
ncbi:DUF3085 domain-containing protein (plasmid) [Streptomyces sp. NBC_01281]|uniref:hypothetical protein n=1 Tax=Streptomyces sp. NBC_01281 TaxID=2903811 RepID=UPI002E0DB076|nr:DUF3085 domain-containing protein [Streptomyces sp. NBC_01281]WSK66593.1 DUF3085 domain-containing protein [Streptomyces sp. NBC_01281]